MWHFQYFSVVTDKELVDEEERRFQNVAVFERSGHHVD